MNRPARFDGHVHEIRAAAWFIFGLALIGHRRIWKWLR